MSGDPRAVTIEPPCVDTQGAEPLAESRPGRWYVVALLAAIAGMAAVDRYLPFLLGEQIKRDLNLSDAQLGLIGGMAFALFHTVFALPLAYLADRTTRKWVIVCSLGCWSLMTVLGGLTRNFMEMFLTRAGVGIGEGGSTGPGQSLIADYFPPHQRATAMGMLVFGTTAGVMVGYSVGGWLSDVSSWRTAYFAFGLPGVALAILAAFTLREPTRSAPPPSQGMIHVWDAARRLATVPTLRWLTLAAAVHTFASSGVSAWLAPYLMRTHELTATQTGLALGVPTGVVGGLGVIAGGFISDRLSVRDPRWYLWLPAIGITSSLVLYGLAFLAPSPALFFVAFVPGLFFSLAYAGPTFAMVQNLAHRAQSALTAAMAILVINLLGASLGPPVVGYVSDLLTASGHSASLRIAVLAVILTNAVSAAFYLIAARTVRSDLQRMSA